MPTKLRIRRKNNKPAISGADIVRLRRMPRVEVKQINVSAAGAAYYDGVAGSIMLDVTAIAQGNTGATRVGDSCRLQQLSFQGAIYNNIGAGANQVVNTRILFFQYMGDTSVANKPIISDMLNVSNANGGTTYGTWSAFDIDYGRVYRVLWDLQLTTYAAPTGVTSTYIGVTKDFHANIPLSRAQRELNFLAGATTGNNHIFMCVTSAQATAAANPSITYNLDVRFTDL